MPNREIVYSHGGLLVAATSSYNFCKQKNKNQYPLIFIAPTLYFLVVEKQKPKQSFALMSIFLQAEK